MGAKTWMLGYANGSAANILRAHPALDREATAAAAKQLFPSERLVPGDDTDLFDTCPPDNQVHIGCFPGLTIVAAEDIAIDYPSKLDPRFLEFGKAGTVCLHAMHSAVDWFAFAIWENGELKRSLSLSPDSGIMEDIGPRLPFEEAFWAGQHPVVEPGEEDDGYPFPFHPLELGEAALLELFGYQLEGYITADQVAPETVPLMRFKRKAWWKLW